MREIHTFFLKNEQWLYNLKILKSFGAVYGFLNLIFSSTHFIATYDVIMAAVKKQK